MPEIFQFTFMVRAFIAGGVIGLAAPMLGTFLILRRLSLIAETLAHVALAGAAIGLFLDKYPVFIAVGLASAAAFALERLRAARWLVGESALALILYTSLALALVFISLGKGQNVDLFGFLFGNIVTVRESDVWATCALGGAVLLLVLLLYNEMVQSTFDSDLARVSGVPVGRVNLAMAVLTGVIVTLSMRVVGALLVGALIVFPVLASLQLGRGFRTTLWGAAAIGVVSVFTGLTISYYQDIAASGAIVLVALGLLSLATLSRSVLDRSRRRHGAKS
jgi:zinc transport system permease protein